MCAIWGMIPFFSVLLALGMSAAPQVIVTQQGVVPIGGLQQLPPGFGGPGPGPGFGPPVPGNIAALRAFGQPLPPGFGGPGFGPGFGPAGPGGLGGPGAGRLGPQEQERLLRDQARLLGQQQIVGGVPIVPGQVGLGPI